MKLFSEAMEMRWWRQFTKKSCPHRPSMSWIRSHCENGGWCTSKNYKAIRVELKNRLKGGKRMLSRVTVGWPVAWSMFKRRWYSGIRRTNCISKDLSLVQIFAGMAFRDYCRHIVVSGWVEGWKIIGVEVKVDLGVEWKELWTNMGLAELSPKYGTEWR